MMTGTLGIGTARAAVCVQEWGWRAHAPFACTAMAFVPPLPTSSSFTSEGRVAFALRKRRKNGDTHRFFTPLQLLRRLAWLIPPPRQKLVRYQGTLSGAAQWRSEVVPSLPLAPDSEASRTPVPEAIAPACAPATDSATGTTRRGSRICWASLLRRVYDLDSLASPRPRLRRPDADPVRHHRPVRPAPDPHSSRLTRGAPDLRSGPRSPRAERSRRRLSDAFAACLPRLLSPRSAVASTDGALPSPLVPAARRLLPVPAPHSHRPPSAVAPRFAPPRPSGWLPTRP
jgi:hypothetical protein